MARLMASKSYTDFFFLETQYRMHPSIAAFPSERFYEGRLVTDTSCALRPRLGDGGGGRRGSGAVAAAWRTHMPPAARGGSGGGASDSGADPLEALLAACEALETRRSSNDR